MTGRFMFSDRDTTDGTPAGNMITMSKKLLWGATTRIGASFTSALRPFTLTQWKPTQKNTARPSSHRIGWNNQRRQPDKGLERSSWDRPANLGTATIQAAINKIHARKTRMGSRVQPRIMPCRIRGLKLELFKHNAGVPSSETHHHGFHSFLRKIILKKHTIDEKNALVLVCMRNSMLASLEDQNIDDLGTSNYIELLRVKVQTNFSKKIQTNIWFTDV